MLLFRLHFISLPSRHLCVGVCARSHSKEMGKWIDWNFVFICLSLLFFSCVCMLCWCCGSCYCSLSFQHCLCWAYVQRIWVPISRWSRTKSTIEYRTIQFELFDARFVLTAHTSHTHTRNQQAIINGTFHSCTRTGDANELAKCRPHRLRTSRNNLLRCR